MSMVAGSLNKKAGPSTAVRRACVELSHCVISGWVRYAVHAAVSGLAGAGAGTSSRAAASIAAASPAAAPSDSQWRRWLRCPCPRASSRRADMIRTLTVSGVGTAVERTSEVSWRSSRAREAQPLHRATCSRAATASCGSNSPRLKAVSRSWNCSQVIGSHPSQLGREQPLQAAAGPVQARQDRAPGHAHHLGGLRARQPVDVDQCDRDAKFLRELGAGPADALPVQLSYGLLLRAGLVARRLHAELVRRVQPDQWQAAIPAVLRAEQVVLDAQQPGLAVGARLERRERAQRSEHGFLGEVLRRGALAGQAQGSVVQRVHMRYGGRLEPGQLHWRRLPPVGSGGLATPDLRNREAARPIPRRTRRPWPARAGSGP